MPEFRAQRILNKNRVPEIADYILRNPTGYVFSALTASISAELRFDSYGEGGHEQRVGLLHIPMAGRFIINDGQHRRAAIQVALEENPDLGDESIPVVFFEDLGLERSQQMFADLNRHAIRPSPSIGVLYDHRDDIARLTRLMVAQSAIFRDVVETEKSTLSSRSRKLFTLSALYGATTALLKGCEESFDEQLALAKTFWEAAAEQFPEWDQVRKRVLTAGEVRQDFIHSHGTVLHAVGRVGARLLAAGATPDGFARRLAPLAKLDWSRRNAALWEGRALLGGRVSKAGQNVTLTTNVILEAIGLPLTDEEQTVEDAFAQGQRGSDA